jgi:hypothetical protein
MDAQQILKDLDAIDQDQTVRHFWEVLMKFLEQSGAPLVLDLESDGFGIYAVSKDHPLAVIRLIEKDGVILCARNAYLPGFKGQIGTKTMLTDATKATRIYRRVVEHLLEA